MSKIDRFMNTVADWASVDVSVDEMADLIEKRAILNHTPKELESLEDIMRKTWVLAVGNGMRRRKYEFDDGKISIVMDFNPFLHTCATIQVWDNENKITYFLVQKRRQGCPRQAPEAPSFGPHDLLCRYGCVSGSVCGASVGFQ